MEFLPLHAEFNQKPSPAVNHTLPILRQYITRDEFTSLIGTNCTITKHLGWYQSPVGYNPALPLPSQFHEWATPKMAFFRLVNIYENGLNYWAVQMIRGCHGSIAILLGDSLDNLEYAGDDMCRRINIPVADMPILDGVPIVTRETVIPYTSANYLDLQNVKAQYHEGLNPTYNDLMIIEMDHQNNVKNYLHIAGDELYVFKDWLNNL